MQQQPQPLLRLSVSAEHTLANCLQPHTAGMPACVLYSASNQKLAPDVGQTVPVATLQPAGRLHLLSSPVRSSTPSPRVDHSECTQRDTPPHVYPHRQAMQPSQPGSSRLQGLPYTPGAHAVAEAPKHTRMLSTQAAGVGNRGWLHMQCWPAHNTRTPGHAWPADAADLP